MKTKMNGTYIALIIIGLVLAYIAIKTNLAEKHIRDGVEIAVTVSMCRIERVGIRSPVNLWCSSGYYDVNGKVYRHRITGRVIPLGTEFKIKYDPRQPNVSRLVNPHEFDKYPREMKKK